MRFGPKQWYVRFLIVAGRRQLSAVKKMDHAIKWLGIPMQPSVKTRRGAMIRAVLLWIVLVTLFVLLGRLMMA
jgi:hypothetical protein